MRYYHYTKVLDTNISIVKVRSEKALNFQIVSASCVCVTFFSLSYHFEARIERSLILLASFESKISLMSNRKGLNTLHVSSNGCTISKTKEMKF